MKGDETDLADTSSAHLLPAVQPVTVPPDWGAKISTGQKLTAAAKSARIWLFLHL